MSAVPGSAPDDQFADCPHSQFVEPVNDTVAAEADGEPTVSSDATGTATGASDDAQTPATARVAAASNHTRDERGFRDGRGFDKRGDGGGDGVGNSPSGAEE
ncbi:MAG: hypothetical protein LBR07_04130 [Puniceicoccales bacterium]|nr:hypothetical protein [Puniceicoccales bacterium]